MSVTDDVDLSGDQPSDLACHASIIFAPFLIFFAAACTLPSDEECVKLPRSAAWVFTAGAAGIVVSSMRIVSLIVSNGVDSARDFAELMMEGLLNGIVAPGLVLLVVRGQMGPWGALSLLCTLAPCAAWACTATIWLVSGGLQLYTMHNLPWRVAVSSTVSWLLVGSLCAASCRQTRQHVVNAILPRAFLKTLPSRRFPLGTIWRIPNVGARGVRRKTRREGNMEL